MSRTKALTRATDYRITETLGNSEFVGWKVRIMLTQQEEKVPLGPLDFLYDLEGYMLSGKFQGQKVDLPPCKLTSAPVRKCNCSAYKFSHAPGFGDCKIGTKFEQVAPPGLVLEDLFQ